MKFVDDLSVAVKVNLDDDLVNDEQIRQKPLTFDEMFETKLVDENLLQETINNLRVFANERQMIINTKKSSVMKFTKSRTKDFPVEMKLDHSFLEVKSKVKVLGVILTSDLRWNSNTEFMCKKAFKNIWILRRIKALKMDPFTILDYYFKEIRVHVELAVPVWHSGLTVRLSADIERVQRVAVSIVLGETEFNYGRSCAMLGLKPLYIQRQELCERFSRKTAAPQCRHNDLFQIQTSGYDTRSNAYREHFCHTTRFYNSALPFLTRTLNQL